MAGVKAGCVHLCRVAGNTVSVYTYLCKGDALSYNVGMNFSTKDRDFDTWNNGSCAQLMRGGWWYKNENCTLSNLSGPLLRGKITGNQTAGMTWNTWRGPNYSLKRVEIKLRPYKKRR